MALDGEEKTLAVRDRHIAVAIDKGLDVALDDAEWRAQLVRDIGDEILPHPLEFFLLGDVMEDEKRPRTLGAVQRRDERTGHLDPRGLRTVDKLDLVLRFGPAGADRIDVGQEIPGVQHEFEPLLEDVLGPREDRLQSAVGQENVIVRIDDEHRLLQAPQCGLELHELAEAELVQAVVLCDQLVGPGAKLVPVDAQAGRLVLVQEGLLRVGRKDQAADGTPVIAQFLQRHAEANGEDQRDQDEHDSTLRSAIR